MCEDAHCPITANNTNKHIMAIFILGSCHGWDSEGHIIAEQECFDSRKEYHILEFFVTFSLCILHWSIKGIYFLQNANNLNFKLFLAVQDSSIGDLVTH